MTISSLASGTIYSPNHYNGRSDSVKKITIHHMAGVMTAEQCGYVFSSTSRQASSNYGIGVDGEIYCYVDEDNAAWTSSSYWNDNQAITIEVSNSFAGDPWPISDASKKSLIALCADICKRYGIEPSYTGDTDGTFTEHRMFAATGCPGQHIHERMNQIVKEVKEAMNGTGGEWIEDSIGWWYKRYDGTYPANEWEKIENKWYWFDSEGYMVTGWLSQNGYKYYLQPKTSKTGNKYGHMVTGWKTINGKKYRFNSEGRMQKGFIKVGGKWYCLGSNGALIKDDLKIVVDPETGVIKF